LEQAPYKEKTMWKVWLPMYPHNEWENKKANEEQDVENIDWNASAQKDDKFRIRTGDLIHTCTQRQNTHDNKMQRIQMEWSRNKMELCIPNAIVPTQSRVVSIQTENAHDNKMQSIQRNEAKTRWSCVYPNAI
jgi:hypothetical protein